MTTWTGRCSSRGVALLGAGIGLVLVAIGLGTVIALSGSDRPVRAGWVLVVAGVAVALAVGVTSRLEVRLTDDALVVRFGPLGWPRRSVALADVRDARAIVVEPLEWGGWGYRWMPWVNASAAVVRRGPGIALTLRDGSRFAVTVDDAVAGAQATSAALPAAQRRG